MKANSILMLLSTLLAVITQTQQSQAQTSGDRLIFQQPPQAKEGSIPGNAVGRGSRNPGDNLCGKTATPLTALVPYTAGSKNPSDSTPDQVLGLTSNSSPTLWFYLPYQSQGNLTAELDVRSQVNGTLKRVNRQSVQLMPNPGLFPISLNTPPLEVGTRYQWVFSVKCNPNDPSANDSVSGWIERVDPSSVTQHRQSGKTTKQIIQAYAQAGLWHDTLTLLMTDLCVSDRQQSQRWFTDLMQSVNLGDIAKHPPANLLQSCPKL